MRSSLAYASLSASPVRAWASQVGDTSWLGKWAQWMGTPLGVKLPNRRMGGEDRWQFESQLFTDVCVCVTTHGFCWSWRPDGREEGSACDGATGETGLLQSPHCAVRLLHAGNLLTSCFFSLFRDLWHTHTHTHVFTQGYANTCIVSHYPKTHISHKVILVTLKATIHTGILSADLLKLVWFTLKQV